MGNCKKFEDRLNSLKNYPCCWVYWKNRNYIIQSRETGNILKIFRSKEEIDNYILEQETF